MASRKATHAGSWYYDSRERLARQIEQFLEDVPAQGKDYDSLPVPGARFLVGPHAGYSWAGSTLAETYKAWDTHDIKRVFILGPSHHVAFRGAQLTNFHTYETPLGNIPVDRETVEKLYTSGLFKYMSRTTDEDEHSFEMHLPFMYQVTQESPRPIVPILLGTTDAAYEGKLAALLAPFFADKHNAFVISTDFCHWGSRFGYTAYTDSKSVSSIRQLSRISTLSPKVPIYKSIEYLDRMGMTVASTGSYDKWQEYLEDTDNTICGRTPLGVLLKTVELTKAGDSDYGRLKWIGYTQSSPVTDISDSSVSYASGFAVC